jgi:hypothetical protein
MRFFLNPTLSQHHVYHSIRVPHTNSNVDLPLASYSHTVAFTLGNPKILGFVTSFLQRTAKLWQGLRDEIFWMLVQSKIPSALRRQRITQLLKFCQKRCTVASTKPLQWNREIKINREDLVPNLWIRSHREWIWEQNQ